MPSPGNSINSDNRGPAIDIAVWICFILCALSIVAKVWTKLGRRGQKIHAGNLQLDDYLLVLSLLSLGAYSVTVSQQVKAGLGKHLDSLSDRDVARYEKIEYASYFLYVATIFLANATGVVFGLMLEPALKLLRVLQGLMAWNSLWYLASTLATAFQCGTPAPWRSVRGQCFDRAAFWAIIDIINMATNICLAVVLCRIVIILQMSRTRYFLLALFSSRFLLAIPAAFKVFFLFRERHSEQRDPTSSSVDIVISSVLVATMTVMATAWPFMNPVMGHLQPGWSTGAVHLSAQGISGKATRTSDSGATQSTTKHVARLRDPEVSDTTLISTGEYEDRQQSGNKWIWLKH
ncbi:hypothetical protein HBH56_015070 [Parastagonospora nodorum]|uniref:Rhodopsin domain-containing protein n=1 Tax=Phaeosphaeria nodorum (strain SN15 / ATCC MYA-4574 / FGSC 10173) TaxID=321614 RepID=A0A7U2EXS0_PHANO|nr:hypothetical protein HBH56_015070 [Parastagonospora nodorum]QRC94990.1 hypothetical protein JI435_027250 [Parastagonospora nodorum SN15]KAH3937182.1 hypothetical protein HBH54_019370 [Parastagonospora nodorum]KAH3969445.1 hypothetical protein HBH51_123940 [Parastagonospora nodorum]KAH3990445.1 hypothetical protein HBH52_008780 [Parastagonospora nodorum]